MVCGFMTIIRGAGLAAWITTVAVLSGATARSTAAAGDALQAADWPAIAAAFGSPPAEFRLVQYGTHDGAPVPVARMVEAGIGGVMLFMQSGGYLRSDDAWVNLERNVREAKAAGLRVWLADDNGYPSGMAGGLVVESHPEVESRCLVEASCQGSGPTRVHLDLPAGAERFTHGFIYPLVDGTVALDRGRPAAVEPQRIQAEGFDGPWRLHGFATAINREGTQASTTADAFGTSGRYPNLLDAVAVETFLTLTHDAYARRLGPLAGTIDAVYTNEPNLMTLWFLPGQRPGGTAFVPWHEDLARRFRERHGRELPILLPALFGGDDPAARLVRRQFYETVGSTLAENFPRRVTSWGSAVGVRSAGHPLLEESMLNHVAGYGDFWRFMGELDVPACDLPMPDRGHPWNFWMPRLLGSIARAHGRTTVMALLDPIINRAAPQLTPAPDDVRRFVGMAAACGVNQFATYVLWQGYEPAVYRRLSDYIARLCVVLRGASGAADVAVYYPIESFQAEFLPAATMHDRSRWPAAWERMQGMSERQDEVVRTLATRGIDFDWLHGDQLAAARVAEGRLITTGGRYAAIVMPEVGLLPLAAARKLAEFQADGGRIVWVRCLPTMGDAPAEHEVVRGLFATAPVVPPGDVVAALGGLPGDDFAVAVEAESPELFTARFIRAGRRITLLVNNGPAAVPVGTRSVRGGAVLVDAYDPLDGVVTPAQVPGSVTVGPCASLLLVEPP